MALLVYRRVPMSSHVCVPSWIEYVIDKHASKYIIIYPLPQMTFTNFLGHPSIHPLNHRELLACLVFFCRVLSAKYLFFKQHTIYTTYEGFAPNWIISPSFGVKKNSPYYSTYIIHICINIYIIYVYVYIYKYT